MLDMGFVAGEYHRLGCPFRIEKVKLILSQSINKLAERGIWSRYADRENKAGKRLEWSDRCRESSEHTTHAGTGQLSAEFRELEDITLTRHSWL